MKILFLSFFIFILFYPTELHAQKGTYQWTSEWSPFNRLGNSKLFDEGERNTLEWRNRVGKNVGDKFYLGMQGNLTRFSSKGFFKVVNQSSFSTTYADQHQSTFWGIGPYVTKHWNFSEKFLFSATAYMLAEFGSGNYSLVMEGFSCPNCLSIVALPAKMHDQKIRERSISSGIDIGGSYKLSRQLAFSVTANIFQFVDYRIRENGSPVIANSDQDLIPVLDVSGNHWLSLFGTPIIHGGLILNF